MSIVLFLVVLVILILVHEVGHFVVAKLAKMRVDEFGIGYPPKAVSIRRGETEYSINWLPFGGFVKIYGEDESATGQTGPGSFVGKPKIVQALVLVAGVAMNMLLAWILISTVLAMGTPRALTPEEAYRAPDAVIAVGNVLPGSPAAEAGLMPGDEIVSVTSATDTYDAPDPEGFTAFIANAKGEPLELRVMRGDEELVATVTPKQGVAPSEPQRYALGVGIGVIGTLPVSLLAAPIEGAKLTWELTKQTFEGLVHFFAGVFTFTADLSQVSGPVGIAGAVGDASDSGLAALLSLTAIISINLALINLLPIPALDGGRLLFVLIEAVIRRPIPPGVAATVNAIGFAFLILLMFVVTASDLFKLFA